MDRNPTRDRPTRDDVARAANVSRFTVDTFYSRPLKLSPETRTRILRGIVDARYINPTSGRTEKSALTGRVAYYELPRTWDSRRPNPVFAATFAALTRYAMACGVELRPFAVDPLLRLPRDAFHSPGHRKESAVDRVDLRAYEDVLAVELYERLSQVPRFAGLIINDPYRAEKRLEWLRMAARVAVPHVVLGRPADGVASGGLAIVDIDDEWGFTQLVRHLRQVGCSQIGHVRFADDLTGPPVRRRRAVNAALRSMHSRTGLAESDYSIAIDYDANDTGHIVERIARWISRGEFDGLVCASDRFASLAAHAAALNGLRLRLTPAPDGIVIAGCDDSGERDSWPIGWVSLQQPVTEWAAAAFDSLAQQVERPGPVPPMRLLRPTIVGPTPLDAKLEPATTTA